MRAVRAAEASLAVTMPMPPTTEPARLPMPPAGVISEQVAREELYWQDVARQFPRGFKSSLPSFDQDVAAQGNGADDRTWSSLVDEFSAIRASTLTFFQSLPPGAWMQRGLASDCEFSVRAVAYIIAGHITHHTNIMGERYLRSHRSVQETSKMSPSTLK